MKKQVLLNLDEDMLAKLKKRARHESVDREKTVSVALILRELVDKYLSDDDEPTRTEGGYQGMIQSVSRHLAEQEDCD